MRKTFLCLMALMMVFCMLTACKDSSSDDKTSDIKVDLAEVYEKISTDFDLGELKIIEEKSDLNRYFMIEEDLVDQFAAAMSVESSVYTDIILIEADDEDAVKEIETALNNHLQSRLSEARSYNAEAVEMLESCSVETNGNYVSLIVSENADDIKKLYDSYF